MRPLSPRLKEVLVRLALVVGSLGFVLVLAEVALRLVIPDPPAAAEERSYRFFTYDEKLGWDLVPGAQDRHTSEEFDVAIRINAQGLRSDREVPQGPGPDGRQRLVVLGDSFAFGHGVEVEEGFVTRLEGLLPETDVVNLAVTGYGTDQQLLRFVKHGLAFAPDRVLLALFEGNVFRNARTTQLGYPKPRFALDDGELVLENVPVPRLSPGEKADGAPGGPLLWRLTAPRARDLLEHLGFGEAWPVSEAILRRLDAVCREAGAELVVVLLPKDQAVDGRGPRRWLHWRTLARLRRMLARLDVPYLDLTPALAEHAAAVPTERLYFHHDGHWTAAGHRVAAQAIAAWLRERGSRP